MPGRQVKSLAAIVILTIGCQHAESRTADTTRAPSAVAREPVVDSQRVIDSTPAGLIRRYYASIQSRQYKDAYALWSDSGRASGKTAQEFAAGFGGTESVSVSVGDSADIEGAAGSQYATIPVVVSATLHSGEHQRFVGTYTLRRSMVDGASPEQRKWRIYSATLHKE